MNGTRQARNTLAEAIAAIDDATGPATTGLPEPVFHLVSRLTPMVNVDLLIHDDAGRCLLTWRDDAFYGPGWHVPGGIIRFRERVADRIAAVSAGELGASVESSQSPIAVHEIFHPERDVRGHFVSLLYACRLASAPDASRQFRPDTPRHGDWAWHAGAPDALIEQHRIYIPQINGGGHPARRPPGSRPT
ncbi:MAG: NUDIX hydrolase [Rhodocyclaceae bacterium]|nr:NUDIX hydrolase [Rhodocyclaceae bacterium]